MPAGAIADQYGMSPRRDLGADLAQVGVHGLGIGVGHDHGGAPRLRGGRLLPSVGADGSEDVGGDVPVVAHHARARADRCPDVGVAALLADAGFVPRVKPEGRLWNQISNGPAAAVGGSAALTRVQKFFSAEENKSELKSLMHTLSAAFCLKK